jgi:hypothetical protein
MSTITVTGAAGRQITGTYTVYPSIAEETH